MKFAHWVFRIAAIYGILVLTLGLALPPSSLNRPEFYYGFYGVTIAWQIVYFLISRDPVRFRPVMLVGVFAKGSFLSACVALFYTNRLVELGPLYGGIIDGILAVFFVIAYMRTPEWKGSLER